ncbi:TPA: hypothetical protein R4422_001044 [Campylobacter jejuni]|nr:hypothetical protein [Campylobacter jejuni]
MQKKRKLGKNEYIDLRQFALRSKDLENFNEFEDYYKRYKKFLFMLLKDVDFNVNYYGVKIEPQDYYKDNELDLLFHLIENKNPKGIMISEKRIQNAK